MKYFHALAIFLLIFLAYFGVSTKFTFKPKWSLDYFNPLALSLRLGKLDISNPASTYDLIHFQGRWYVPWGVLPSLILIPLHLFRHQFVPTIYLTVFFASTNVSMLYFLLLRIRKEFFPNLQYYEIFLLLILYSFGTTHFYVGTLGSVWHVDQMVTSFFTTLGIYIIFKKKRELKDYLLATLLFGMSLLGRATTVLMVTLPAFLYVWDHFKLKTLSRESVLLSIKRGIQVFVVPLIFFSAIFLFYNYARFSNPFEYGYRYIQESSYLAAIREKNGIMSFRNVPMNLWYMIFEIPKLTLNEKVVLDINLKGNSIFFLTPPFLAIFLSSPFFKRNHFKIDPYVGVLWLASIITIVPSLLIYSTGWMQFGYRYSLDITVFLLLLSLFGMKGRLNRLYILGIGWSMAMYWLGIHALM